MRPDRGRRPPPPPHPRPPATKSGAAPAASTVAANPVKATAPAQKLTQTNFPDGSGSVGLPAGWKITNAREGDITAQGPKGEKMRFGMAQQAIDYSNPQSRALGRGPGGTAPGNYVAIPFGTPGDVAYKQVLAQLGQKLRKPVPTIDYSMVQTIPTRAAARIIFWKAISSTPAGQASPGSR